MVDKVSWARVVLAWADDRVVVLTLSGEGAPDLSVVDDLARLRLAVRRSGGRMCLEDVAPALSGLLDLAGLLREVSGEAEGGEDSLHLQEGVDPGDAAS
ncbi:MAG TPA: hypothetical protein VK215_06335 [Acidimicrobiales bacterium]|jgi:hypothetical protein|nr:hypothetical protein [Acidimicrobiales bacterium]HLN42050.1 hypothetical protein [Acidimicrobiales bacterium]